MDIAENETRYVTGDDQVDVNGTSYAPSDLAVQAGKKITLPKDASFADAELSLGVSVIGRRIRNMDLVRKSARGKNPVMQEQ